MLGEESTACFEVISFVYDADSLGLYADFPCKLRELAYFWLLIDVVLVLIVVLSFLNSELDRKPVPHLVLISQTAADHLRNLSPHMARLTRPLQLYTSGLILLIFLFNAFLHAWLEGFQALQVVPGFHIALYHILSEIQKLCLELDGFALE